VKALHSVFVFFLQLIIDLIVWAPNRFLGLTASFMAFFYRYYAVKECRQLEENIDKVLGLPRHSSFAKDFANQVVYHQFRSSFESLKVIWGRKKITIDGVAEYKAVLDQATGIGKGVIIATAHIGSWELLSKVTAECLTDSRLVVLAKPARQRFVTILLEQLRERAGVGVLWLSSKSLLKDMLRTLSEKNALGFVMDQKPKGRVGTEIYFYGHSAEFVRGPAQLSCKHNTPVVSAFCLRVAPMHYKIVLSDTLEGFSLDQEDELTNALVQNIEKIVRMYPEQWCWNYKRWKFAK